MARKQNKKDSRQERDQFVLAPQSNNARGTVKTNSTTRHDAREFVSEFSSLSKL